MAAPNHIDTLLSPTLPAEAEWKRYLFYMIAYCDTWHDFSKERPLEGEGRSVSKTDVPDRPAFVMSIIEEMNSEFISKQIIEALKPGRGFSFENNVGKEFLRATDNIILGKIPDVAIRTNIENYIKGLFTITELKDTNQYEYLSLSNFNSEVSVPPKESSLIEITIPASVYSAGTVPDNIIKFLRILYPESTEGYVLGSGPPHTGPLRFIEDAASFPRELFTGKLGNFKKVVTTQTRWDPAGLSMSGFEGNTIPTNEKVIAPSFLAEYHNSHNITEEELNSYYFDQAKNTLIRPDRGELMITKAGPSVNHIFMHMILEKQGLPDLVKNKYKAMINAAKVESKKNMTLPLDAMAGGVVAEQRAERLRKLAASKRSGDYENIHSAIRTKAIMFTGDEPAFTYGVLNKCRMIYHVNTRGTHTFKVFIPPPEDENDLKAQKLKTRRNGLILEASELLKIFGATTRFYNEYLTNISTVLFSKLPVSVCGDPEVGRILQMYFVNELLNEKPFFEQLRKACKLYEKLGIPPITYDGLLQMDVEALEKVVADEKARIGGIYEEGTTLLNKINEIRKKVPLRFTVLGQNRCNPLKATIFEELQGAKLGSEFISVGEVKYALIPGSMFPEYKYLEGNLSGIARLKKINARTTNPGLLNKNKKLIAETLDSLDISFIPTQDQINAVKPDIIRIIDALLLEFPPAVGGRIPGQKNRRNKKMSYEEIYKKLLYTEKSELPFDFTPKEYADAFIYRYIVNDCINKISNDEMNSLSKVTVLEEEAENASNPYSPDPKRGRYDSEPLPLESPLLVRQPMLVQSGGDPVPLDDEIKSFCIHLYYNSIEPFLRKYSFNDARLSSSDVTNNLLRSAVTGSLFEDLEVLLEEICGSPTFTKEYIVNKRSLALYDNMIIIATSAINSIFKKLKESSGNSNSNIHIRTSGQGAGIGILVENIQGIYALYNEPDRIVSDNFFSDMANIYIFLDAQILYDPAIIINESREEVTKKFNDVFATYNEEAIDNNKKEVLTSYIKFAVKDYIESQNFIEDTPDEIAAEQAKGMASFTRIITAVATTVATTAAAKAAEAARAAEAAAAVPEEMSEHSVAPSARGGRRGRYGNMRSRSRYRRNGSPRRKTLKRR